MIKKNQSQSESRQAIGLLYPGEMGSCLAGILVKQGYRVVTTLAGRSDRTRQQAAGCGAALVDSLDELARQAGVVISVVPPAAAESVAAEYLAAARRHDVAAVYVDANAVSPATAKRIGGLCETAGVDFVDASIHGLAAKLPANGTLYLSGERAAQIAALFEASLCVRILGPDPGTASAVKMLVGGLNKGVLALFTELALLADSLGMLDETLDIYQQSYPGVMEVVARLLPTYPRHAPRRRQELEELSQTIRDTGCNPNMAAAAAETMSLFVQASRSTADFDAMPVEHQHQTITDLVHRFSPSLTSNDLSPIPVSTS